MTTPAFNSLITLLGRESARRFLAFAQPKIDQCKHDLLTSLQQHDWNSAAATAHRFKATAHLYSSATLLAQLDTIIDKNQNTLQHTHFLDELTVEFQRTERAIQQFLSDF